MSNMSMHAPIIVEVVVSFVADDGSTADVRCQLPAGRLPDWSEVQNVLDKVVKTPELVHGGYRLMTKPEFFQKLVHDYYGNDGVKYAVPYPQHFEPPATGWIPCTPETMPTEGGFYNIVIPNSIRPDDPSLWRTDSSYWNNDQKVFVQDTHNRALFYQLAPMPPAQFPQFVPDPDAAENQRIQDADDDWNEDD